jgi:hypothetical protein
MTQESGFDFFHTRLRGSDSAEFTGGASMTPGKAFRRIFRP